MNPRSSIDARLFALVTIAFGVLCAGALFSDLWPVADAQVVSSPV